MRIYHKYFAAVTLGSCLMILYILLLLKKFCTSIWNAEHPGFELFFLGFWFSWVDILPSCGLQTHLLGSWFSVFSSELPRRCICNMEKKTSLKVWKVTIFKKQNIYSTLPKSVFHFQSHLFFFWGGGAKCLDFFWSWRLISWWCKRHYSPPIRVLEPNCAGWICITRPWLWSKIFQALKVDWQNWNPGIASLKRGPP